MRLKKNLVIAILFVLSLSETLAQQVSYIATEDTYVSQFQSDLNFGLETELLIKGSSNGTFDRKTYVQFDFSGSPTPSEQIVLKFVKSGGEELESIDTFETETTWSESSMTWNTTPANLETLDFTQVRDGAIVYMDVTNYVNSKIANNEFVISLVLSSNDIIGLPFTLHSKESPSDSNRPKLLFYDAVTVDFSDDIVLSKYISSDMVIQRAEPFPFRGTGPSGQSITVDFVREGVTESVSGNIDEDGNFNVLIPPMESTTNACTATLSIAGFPNKTIALSNILIGDVWFAGGQSNMEWKVFQVLEATNLEADADNFPSIRAFRTRTNSIFEPSKQFNENTSPWVVCNSAHVNGVSAVAYIFAKEVFQETGIPIGIMQSYLGGTDIETWLSEDKIRDDKKLQFLEDRLPSYNDSDEFLSRRYPSVNYNGMINPLRFYPIKGFLFYQGENNVLRATEYAVLMKSLIQDYRSKWNLGELPFYFVQLPNIGITSQRNYESTPNENTWQRLRQEQYLVAEKSGLENIGMAVIIETNEVRSDPDPNIRIHPRNKTPVGKRLSRLALKELYAKDILAHSPFVENTWVEGSKVYIRMKNVGDGLKIRDNETNLVGFAIGNSSNAYFDATVIIEEPNLLSVESNQVPNPEFIAYGWSMDPLCTLDNSADLPASPFKIVLGSKKTYSVIDDSFIEKGMQGSTNYGASLELEVTNGPSETDGEKVTYLKFDIRNLAFTTVSNANLRLYVNSIENSTTISAHNTQNDWEEETITSNNAPSVGTEITTANLGEAATFYNFNVTSALRTAITNEDFFFSIALKNISSDAVVFASKESNINRPSLVLNDEMTLSSRIFTEESSFIIFPNPVKDDILQIRSPSFNQNTEVTFRITNLLGQEFSVSSFRKENSYEVNVSNLASGTYILSVESGNNRSFKKIIIQ